MPASPLIRQLSIHLLTYAMRNLIYIVFASFLFLASPSLGQSWEVYDFGGSIQTKAAYQEIDLLGESVITGKNEEGLFLLSPDLRPVVNLQGYEVFQYLKPWILVKGPKGIGAFHEYGQLALPLEYEEISTFTNRLLARRGTDYWVYEKSTGKTKWLGSAEEAKLTRNGQVILKNQGNYFLPLSSNPDIDDVIEADNNEWCIGEYKTFYERDDLDMTLISTVSFCAVNGYSEVQDGINFEVAKREYLLLANELIKVYWNPVDVSTIPYYNFICKDTSDEYTAVWVDKTETFLKTQTFYSGENDFFNFAIPLVYGASVRLEIYSEKYGKIYKIDTEEICEPKYPIQVMWFVNKLGGWNQFTFFKASYNSIDVKNSDYALMQKDVDYDPRKGQTKPFNINGNGSIKVNTGWVTENYYEWIEQMMLSDTILLNPETPVRIKTTSMQKKTSVNDKTINYTLDFEFANKLINNII